MTDTVQKIIDMDKAARKRTADARAEAQRIAEEAAEKCRSCTLSRKAETEKKAEAVCYDIKEKSDKEIAKMRLEADEKCRRLDEVMSDDVDKRIDEIIERIFEDVKNG